MVNIVKFCKEQKDIGFGVMRVLTGFGGFHIYEYIYIYLLSWLHCSVGLTCMLYGDLVTYLCGIHLNIASDDKMFVFVLSLITSCD